jgi:hypothetical protein
LDPKKGLHIDHVARTHFTDIALSFDSRTLANMEVALERASDILSAGSEQHPPRRHIASKILECAKDGEKNLGGFTTAGLVAASELSVAHDA